MQNKKIIELEEKMRKMFGDNTSLAITNARLGSSGYFTRVEARGLPFKIDSHKKTQEEAEESALDEFETQMAWAIEEKLFFSKSFDEYIPHDLIEEKLDQIFEGSSIFNKAEALNKAKQDVQVLTCKLDDGRYETVIVYKDICLFARGTGLDISKSVDSAIQVAQEVLNPTTIVVRDYPKNN